MTQILSPAVKICLTHFVNTMIQICDQIGYCYSQFLFGNAYLMLFQEQYFISITWIVSAGQ